jgi:ligand-binding sensor domain-containing protein/signal transduction histidine kinase
MATLQDRRGYVWVGTEDGLGRYDGYGFETFRHDPADPRSLSDNYIIALHESRDGTLWVGTSDGGLNRFDGTGFESFRHSPDEPTSLPHDRVTSIAEDASGALWVGTRGGGLARLDAETQTFARFRHDSTDVRSLPSDQVWALLTDSRGRLWVGTRGGGLARLDGDGFVRYRHDPTDDASLPGNDVLDLYEGDDGSIWIATFGHGLARLDPDTGTARTYRHDPDDPDSLPSEGVVAVHQDRAGDVWAGTWGGGLGRLDPSTGRVTRYAHDPADAGSLGDVYVRSLYESPQGLLWVGTVSAGLSVRSPARERFHHVRHADGDEGSLIANYVRAFAEDAEGALWVGTRDGLSRLRDGRFEHVTADGGPGALSASYVRALLSDSRGTLWVGTATGLNRREPDGRFTRFLHNPEAAADGDPNVHRVYVILEARDGLLWVGTRDGLHAFDREREAFVRHLRHDPERPNSLPDNEVISLAEGDDGVLWVGTTGGLLRLDGDRARRYVHDPSDPHSLSNDRVFSLFPAEDGGVWVGTNSGLGRLDLATGRFRHITTRDGLPNDLIYGILSDETGRLWLSTNKGLARLDTTSGEVRTYDASDGLQSNEFNQGAYFRARNGDLLFGGINGYNRFAPGAIVDNPHVPPVVLTAFRIFDRPMPIPHDEIRLGHEDDFFALEFAALDYANPARNQYQYRLEGFESEWQDAGTRRYVSYSNLDGGRYTFRVRGSNSDGVWNEAGLAVPLTVVPPYWETGWFRLALALGVLLLGFGTAWVWQRGRLQIVERSRAQIAEAQRRLSEGREQERLHLARELHDGPVQDLYTAKLRLSLAAEAADLNGELRPVEEALGRVNAALRGICGELRPPALGPFGLAAALRSHAEALRTAYPDLSFELHLAADGQRLPETVRLALFRIAQEALSNAARHGRARTVEVVFTVDAEEAVLEVRDDGRGFSVPPRPLDDARAGRFGLLGMTERAEALGGRLVVTSSPGRGTTVTARVPATVERSGADTETESAP